MELAVPSSYSVLWLRESERERERRGGRGAFNVPPEDRYGSLTLQSR